MTTEPTQKSRLKWLPATAALIAIIALSVFLLTPKGDQKEVVKEAKQVLTVEEGEAGKVGDLQVTEEALQLAKISVEAAQEQLVTEKLEVSGIVKAGGDNLVKITPRVTGKVIKLLARTGDQVKAGQKLAILESTELAQAQSLYRQASARVNAAKKTLDRQKELAMLGQFGRPQVEDARRNALESESDVNTAEQTLAAAGTTVVEAESDKDSFQSKIEQAQAELDVTKSRLDRAEALFKEELISKQELERVRADHQKAVADVNVAKSSLAQGEARLTAAKDRVRRAEGALRLAKQKAAILKQSLEREEKVYKGQFMSNREIVQAETELRQTQVEVQGASDTVRLLGGTPGGGNTVALVTPITGRVQDREATLGETIDSEHAAFTVVNLDEVWAEISILPRNLSAVLVGDLVELTSEAAPEKVFKGTILSIGTVADETTRSVVVRTTLGNEGQLLKPGSFIRGSVETDIRHERVTVPIGAIQDHTGKPTVYVALEKTGAFEVRHVKLGITRDGWREISEGLKAGEQVAASGTFYLKSEALKSSLSDGCCAP